jgi:shikimate kinase
MTDTDPLDVPQTIVLIGLMGAGKTCIGSRLADRLGLAFVDADVEIELAAGCSISDIFEIYGEDAFRDGERRVIRRLLGSPFHVLATGGGAFMDAETRAAIGRQAISIWLRADLDLLVSRVGRRDHRPLLKQGNRRDVLEALIAERYPVYGKADIVVDSGRESPDATVDRVIEALRAYLSQQSERAQHQPEGAES